MTDNPTKKPAFGGKRHEGFRDPVLAAKAGRASAEARKRRMLATKKPKDLAEDSLIGLVAIRDRLRKRLEAMKEDDPRGLDVEKTLADLEVRILDRISGKPMIAKPAESGSPEDYRKILSEFPPEPPLEEPS